MVVLHKRHSQTRTLQHGASHVSAYHPNRPTIHTHSFIDPRYTHTPTGTKKIEEVTEKISKDENIKEAAGTIGYRVGVTVGKLARMPANFIGNVRKEMEKIKSQMPK